MFAITHRPIVSISVLTFALLAPGSAHAQSTSDRSPSQPATRSDVAAGDHDDAELVLAEPDFRVLNLPSTLRLPVHGSNFELTHRFNGNLRRGSFSDEAGDLFGLDEGAAVGI